VKDPEQSWHSFIGKKFEKIIFNAIKGYVETLKREYQGRYPELVGLSVLSDSDITSKNKYRPIFKKLAVKYGDHYVLPDTDIVIANYSPENPKVLAVVSCKTSLRERIAQSCYWKLKLLSSRETEHVKIYLVIMDNDRDFDLNYKRRRHYDGKSRNRLIAEYELDGVYIVREDFKEEWESEKVKRYDKLFPDIERLILKSTSRALKQIKH
jgi:type II restriction enzyme